MWINTFESVSVQFWPHTFGHVSSSSLSVGAPRSEPIRESQSERASVCRRVVDLSMKLKFIFNPFTALNKYTFRFWINELGSDRDQSLTSQGEASSP